MTQTESHHYTAEQVGQHLDEALAIVAERELDPEISKAVLPQLISMLGAKSIMQQVPQPMPIARDLDHLIGRPH